MRTLNGPTVTQRLKNFDLRTLFIQELGWDHGGPDADVTVGNRTFTLQAIAHTRGMVAYQYVADVDDVFPDHPTRRKIERAVAKTVREHVIVYPSHDRNALYWQWVTRKQGRSDRSHTSIYHLDHPDDALIRKLEQLVCTPDEEENNPNVADGSDRMLAAFDVEKVIRQFYDRLKKQRDRFQGFIKGIPNLADQEWYASLMLNRIMFLYFIQKGEFLDGDPDYLRNRLERIQRTRGKDRLQRFYRSFLLKLFHEGLSRPEAERAPESAELLGTIPYLNGGLFDVHDLERDNPDIRIPDKAFGKIFAFFDAYQWRLDDRPLRNDNEINLDVLGSIFEKYVNQKQMVAYYTKEDVTCYISRNTILPFLFHRVKQDCSIAFNPDGGVWRLLADDPDRYVYDAVRHGITYDVHKRETLTEQRELPSEIAAGLNDVAHRGGWNDAAPPEYALPTETWREHVARRQRYEEVRAKLAAGKVTSINDLITDNLDIEQFAQDVIANSEGPELVRAFWKAINAVSVLDPTCGSGAFLIAAMNVLEPMYVACLDAMRGHLDDLTRSTHTHDPEHLNDFRTILDRAATRAGERDFILKSIMVNNVYGVDIMDEAVELCKLRLLLKLFTETSPDRIEPLPDVALNVRAGNTLVGFTSIKDIQEAFVMTQGDQRNMFSPEDTIDLTRIEAHAEAADLAFRRVRAVQAEHGVDAGAFARVKSDLRERLDDLRHEFDEYWAGNDGVKTTDEEAYRQWRHSHRAVPLVHRILRHHERRRVRRAHRESALPEIQSGEGSRPRQGLRHPILRQSVRIGDGTKHAPLSFGKLLEYDGPAERTQHKENAPVDEHVLSVVHVVPPVQHQRRCPSWRVASRSQIQVGDLYHVKSWTGNLHDRVFTMVRSGGGPSVQPLALHAHRGRPLSKPPFQRSQVRCIDGFCRNCTRIRKARRIHSVPDPCLIGCCSIIHHR